MSTPTRSPGGDTTTSGPARSDLVGTAALAVVGLFAVVVGARYEVWPDGAVGAGFLPVVTGGFILVASLVELLRLHRARRRPVTGPVTGAERIAAEAARQAAVGQTDVFGRTESQRSRATTLIFVIVGIALALVPVVGLLLSLTLLVFTLLLVMERKPFLAAAGGALVSLVVAWSVFVLLLAIPLPRGVLDLL